MLKREFVLLNIKWINKNIWAFKIPACGPCQSNSAGTCTMTWKNGGPWTLTLSTHYFPAVTDFPLIRQAWPVTSGKDFWKTHTHTHTHFFSESLHTSRWRKPLRWCVMTSLRKDRSCFFFNQSDLISHRANYFRLQSAHPVSCSLRCWQDIKSSEVRGQTPQQVQRRGCLWK